MFMANSLFEICLTFRSANTAVDSASRCFAFWATLFANVPRPLTLRSREFDQRAREEAYARSMAGVEAGSAASDFFHTTSEVRGGVVLIPIATLK